MKEQINFETGVKRLEEILSDLEKGEVSLNQSMALFEEGVTLSKKLKSLLDHAQSKIQILVSENEPEFEDFVKGGE